MIALKLTYVDLCQDQGKKGNDSPVSKVLGSRFKSAITLGKIKKKIKRPLDISNGTRMNWLMKKTGYKKSRETVPLNAAIRLEQCPTIKVHTVNSEELNFISLEIFLWVFQNLTQTKR